MDPSLGKFGAAPTTNVAIPTRARFRGAGLLLLLVITVTMALAPGLATASAPAHVASALPGASFQVAPSLSPALPPGALEGPSVALSTPIIFNFEFAVPSTPAETAYLNGLYTPGSPYYHHFLLDDGFFSVYGPSPEQTTAFMGYLGGQGISITPGGGPWLYQATGSAASIEAAFHTSLSEYTEGGKTEMAPTSPLELPAAFSGLLNSVSGLNQFALPHPDYVKASAVTPAAAATPSIFQTFYNATGLISGGDTGSKYAIGLAEMCDSSVASTSYQTEVNSFDSANSLPAITLNMMLDTGASTCSSGTNGGWSTETDLDIQSSHSLATGETLYVCLDNSDPDTCDQNFVNDQTADNIQIGSNSFGGGSDDASVWTAAYSAGITLFASAGDSCEAVDYPAADPHGLGVGGTTMAWGTGGTFSSETVWSCSGGSGTGGGCDTTDAPPSYQVGMTGYPGVCKTGDRGDPDVGMDANPSSGLNIYASGCSPCQYGGTSLASPLWAASLDLIYSSVGDTGMAGPNIYAVAKSANYDAAFHDITSGSNDQSATVGWDPDTGVGSPNIGELAALWVGSGPTTYTVTFAAVPTSCTVTFNGTTYSNGGTATHILAGSYPLVANACAGEVFSAWTSTAGTVAGTTSSTTVTISATGTITATYVTAPTYTVSFATSPTTCTLTFDGVSYSNGGSVTIAAGNYTLAANACAGETFLSWSSTAGTVAGPGTASTTVLIASVGTITATYQIATYGVTLVANPAACAPVTFDSSPYPNNGVATVPAGSYALSAGVCAGFTFEDWTTSPSASISIATSTSASTTATVSAAGTITAHYTVITYPVDFAVAPSACVTAGTEITFDTTAYANGGSATVAAGTYGLSVGSCAGYHFGSWSVSSPNDFDVTSATAASTSVLVNNTGTITATFITNNFNVAIVVTPATCGPVTISGTPYTDGGTASLAKGAYAITTPSCSGQYSPPSVTATGSLAVSGSAGANTVTVSGAGTLTVTYPALLAATIFVPSSAGVDDTVGFIVNVTGGLPDYTVTWNFGNSLTASDSLTSGVTSDSEVTQYSSAGTYTVTAQVTDNSGQSTTVTGSVDVSKGSSGGVSGGLLSGNNLLYLAILLVVVVAVVIGLALASRRRKEPPAGGPYGGNEAYYAQPDGGQGGYYDPSGGGYGAPPADTYGPPPGAPPY